MPIISLSILRKILYSWVISLQIHKTHGKHFPIQHDLQKLTRGQRAVFQMPLMQTAVSVDALRQATVHRNTALSFRCIPIEPICKCCRAGQAARVARKGRKGSGTSNIQARLTAETVIDLRGGFNWLQGLSDSK